MKREIKAKMETIRTLSLEETRAFGKKIAARLKKGDCLLLEGDLGTGKTEVARAIIRALCGNKDVEVTSPTFTLAQDYTSAEGVTIWHYDLYRIEREEEMAELALDDALASGIVLVEWPKKALHFTWPENSMVISALHGNTESERVFHLSNMRD